MAPEGAIYPPAICDDCGTLFSLPQFSILPGAKVRLEDIRLQPCPNCGGGGPIIDGLYDFTGETLTILASLSFERLQALADAIRAARDSPSPRSAITEVLRKDPDLQELARRFVLPRNAGEFYALVTVLLSAITLIIATNSSETRPPRTTINQQTVFEQIAGTKPSPARPKAPPPPPRKTKRRR